VLASPAAATCYVTSYATLTTTSRVTAAIGTTGESPPSGTLSSCPGRPSSFTGDDSSGNYVMATLNSGPLPAGTQVEVHNCRSSFVGYCAGCSQLGTSVYVGTNCSTSWAALG
jgi:hypothetical protein